MKFDSFKSTCTGSFPHLDGKEISQKLIDTLDIPAWPQLPKVSFRESMYNQYSRGMPRLVVDEVNNKIIFNSEGDLSDDLLPFYEHYLAGDPDAFALTREYAAGFFDMLELLKDAPGDWVKGHVTGPVSFSLMITDQDLQPSLYIPELADVITKNMEMTARWQVRQLKAIKENVIVFVDEPYMAQFGSAFISLSREEALGMMNEVFNAISEEGAISGVHCCANTDWSVLLESHVQILNLDAYGYMENLALYPAELRAFLDRGGLIAWGLIPTDENVFTETGESLAAKWHAGIDELVEKAEKRGVKIEKEEFYTRSLISPSCGLGTGSIELAERAIELVGETCATLKLFR
ncbi:MAG: methionine synthase [Chloroflexi bacterium]|jgi:hypothetical protein|nr:methionine synthase [Chloroflexota bacterium]MBT3668715.1 methionine synthase [Chloroflexota bacterium]MBT4305416.1 methionine synthase [Chloroflexota bacterium]MBT4533027.1 methionine synthase [Chloroflexota bacterium]MBT4683223.1 methionine synthase [Chloroflexota bacterium]